MGLIIKGTIPRVPPFSLWYMNMTFSFNRCSLEVTGVKNFEPYKLTGRGKKKHFENTGFWVWTHSFWKGDQTRDHGAWHVQHAESWVFWEILGVHIFQDILDHKALGIWPSFQRQEEAHPCGQTDGKGTAVSPPNKQTQQHHPPLLSCPQEMWGTLRQHF